MRGSLYGLLVLAALTPTEYVLAGDDRIACIVNGKQFTGRDACLAALSGQPRAAGFEVAKTAPGAPATVSARAMRARAVPITEPPAPEVRIFLRKSMEDLKSLSEPSSLGDATGALFSWSDDRAGSNRNFTAQALVGASVSSVGLPQATPYISETFTGAYFQIDRQLNSRDLKKNVDDLIFGGRHELVIANAASTSHYIGVAGEIVADSYGVAKNWNFTADYQPFGVQPISGDRPFISYANWPFDTLKYVLVTFSPKVQAEYRGSLNGNSDPLFKYHNSVFRVGGSLGMNIKPNFLYGKAGLPFLISRSAINVSYGWLYDTLSDRQFGYLDTAYTFNLTETGDVGLTFNYRRGKLQTTAQDVELYKIALSAKFDYEPLFLK